MSTVLVTGVAGFVGFHASNLLLELGYEVIGVDNLNDFYDISLKRARLYALQSKPGFCFHKLDLADRGSLKTALKGREFTYILHLAAQAGVRYSLENPHAYIDSNIAGHLNVLELARHSDSIKHLVYASSSSVYGERESGPFAETDRVRNPVSLYAATKLGGEMMAESYSKLYGIPLTGLRFFTVYGPWGRPDMAYFKFTDAILKNKPITLFAPDEMSRDFTYIDDIVNVLPTILKSPPKSGHEIYNLGNSKPNMLMQLVDVIEVACGRPAEKIIRGKQKGDVTSTYAEVSAAARDFGFDPQTHLEVGIPIFVKWYRKFYGI